jgi:DNA-binding MarR family transcriptional regulator
MSSRLAAGAFGCPFIGTMQNRGTRMRRRSTLRRQEGQDKILAVLISNPQQSLDEIADKVYYSRTTVHSIIKRLVAQQTLLKTRGRGRAPNSYRVVIR